MPDPLEREMRQLLLELELISHGKTMGFEGRTSGSRDRSPLLYGDPDVAHLEYARRWERARSESARAELVKEARGELKRLRRTPPPPKDSAPWQEVVGKDPRPASVVAEEWGITRQYAWQLQQEYKRKGEAA